MHTELSVERSEVRNLVIYFEPFLFFFKLESPIKLLELYLHVTSRQSSSARTSFDNLFRNTDETPTIEPHTIESEIAECSVEQVAFGCVLAPLGFRVYQRPKPQYYRVFPFSWCEFMAIIVTSEVM